ncbi:MAG TPA: transposase [Aciduliprofundum boonei]|uniref:D-aminoacyl-tRNA deacylase n=1 Tax=Candidatus Aciduliprofundum boonei TaxID=379547 RepID=A0A7J3T8P9_9ARCH|nr:transposase [Candidatus Aciduliprofundum boonei]
MDLILTSQDDLASLNIREKLFSLDRWKKIGTFQNFPVYKNEKYYLVHIKGPKIYAENVDRDIREKLGIKFDNIVVASKHRSEAELKSLTVHPIGNWNKAEYGGRDRCVVITNPHLMTQALRILKKNAIQGYAVSFEATHHGPYLETPTFFIEIGSTEEEWRDEKAGEAIAKTILELEEVRYTSALGIGGGHYVPRITDVALEYRISFGHMIPKYAIPNIDEEIVKRACEKSDNCKIAYIHKKGLKGEERRKITTILENIGIKSVSSKELEKL